MSLILLSLCFPLRTATVVVGEGAVPLIATLYFWQDRQCTNLSGGAVPVILDGVCHNVLVDGFGESYIATNGERSTAVSAFAVLIVLCAALLTTHGL